MLNDRLILMLISLASLQLVLCQQNVDNKSPTAVVVEDSQPTGSGGGGGQSRNIYYQPPLSPHRMMHFGKRPAIAPQPSLQQIVDLYPSPDQLQMNNRASRQLQQGADSYPYSVAFNTNRDRIIEQMPDYEMITRDKQLMDIVEHLLQVAKQEACQTGNNNIKKQQDNSQQPTKLMKLLNSDGGNSYEIAAEVERQQQKQPRGEQIDQQQLQDAEKTQEQVFNVVGRSLPRVRQGNELFDVSTDHISSLLFGRRITEPPSSLVSYIKKAEPSKMAFMHFG